MTPNRERPFLVCVVDQPRSVEGDVVQSEDVVQSKDVVQSEDVLSGVNLRQFSPSKSVSKM